MDEQIRVLTERFEKMQAAGLQDARGADWDETPNPFPDEFLGTEPNIFGVLHLRDEDDENDGIVAGRVRATVFSFGRSHADLSRMQLVGVRTIDDGIQVTFWAPGKDAPPPKKPRPAESGAAPLSTSLWGGRDQPGHSR